MQAAKPRNSVYHLSLKIVASCIIAQIPASTTQSAEQAEAHTLDICKYAPAFREEFNRLSVSRSNAETARWTAHTPWFGDFGDAAFLDPSDDQAEGHWSGPFKVEDGILTIAARKRDDGKWTSGLLASADPTTAGYAQTYGYFEARMKLPAGPGVWPAFWLASNTKKNNSDPSIEIDVIEYYGQFPASFESTVHVWNLGPNHDHKYKQIITKVSNGELSKDFHNYGVDVSPELITFYLDRHEIGHLPTPAEHKAPLMLLLNLALGSGWPIDKTNNPSYLLVDYVRTYTKVNDEEGKKCSGD